MNLKNRHIRKNIRQFPHLGKLLPCTLLLSPPDVYKRQLQGRIFSYSDTQRHRLGGANFTEIPINRPICPFHNNQRDGFHRMQIDASPANYDPNSIGNNWPRETPPEKGGFTTSPQTVSGVKERLRSPSFAEYYSHPRLFWMSQTPVEQELSLIHI